MSPAVAPADDKKWSIPRPAKKLSGVGDTKLLQI
jgi:hypothetical protein